MASVLWEPRRPEGKTVQRYARRLAAQAVSALPTLISEPVMVSVTQKARQRRADGLRGGGCSPQAGCHAQRHGASAAARCVVHGEVSAECHRDAMLEHTLPPADCPEGTVG